MPITPEVRLGPDQEGPFAAIGTALEELRDGRMIVVAAPFGGRDRAVVMAAAEHTAPGTINHMVTYARGLVCVCVTEERFAELGLKAQPQRGETLAGTAFGVSIESRDGVTTGVSAADRARTIQVVADPASGPDDLVLPGHVVPLRARRGGVLARRGHTEAAVDLARLAGLSPMAATCEVMTEDGDVVSDDELTAYCREHRLARVYIDDVVEYIRSRHLVLSRTGSRRFDIGRCQLEAVAYRERSGDACHVALVSGDVRGADDVVISCHTACLAGHIFGSRQCECARRLGAGLEAVASAQRGILLYLAHGSGDVTCRAAHAEPAGIARCRLVAAHLLRDLGPTGIRDVSRGEPGLAIVPAFHELLAGDSA